MARLAIQKATYEGLDLALEAATSDSEGDSFINNGRIVLLAVNGSDASRTLTITPVVDPEGGESVTPIDVVIGAGDMAVIGPFPMRYFNDPTGQVFVEYSNEADVEVAAIRVR